MTLYESADSKEVTVKVWCEECKGSGTKESGMLTVRCNHCSGGYLEREVDILYAIHHDWKKCSKPYTITDAVADATVMRVFIDHNGSKITHVKAAIIDRLYKFYCGEDEEG